MKSTRLVSPCRHLSYFLALVALWVTPAASADEIHWTILGQTAVTFDWRGSETTLRYGTTSTYGQTVTATAPDPLPFSSPGPFREAKLTGLLANTVYHYSIGTGPDHLFRTPPPRGSSGFTVAAEADIGDAISYSQMAGVQTLIAGVHPAFVLLPGDLTYGNTNGQPVVDAHFNDVMVWSRDAAYMPAWGNHEYEDPGYDDFRNYKGRFDLPNPRTSPGAPVEGCCGEDWSWFDYGNARFIAYPEPYVDSTWIDWSARARTLMDQAQADTTIRFIVTFGHQPAYSSGYHEGSSTLKAYLDGLGDSHSKYMLNLNGHSHDYERSYPQHGVVHLTVGTGGGSSEPDSLCPWPGCTPPEWSAFRAMRHGLTVLRFTDWAIHGQFLCGPADIGIDDITCTPGSVVDTFMVSSLGPYTIAASAGTGGSISPSGGTWVTRGGSQAYSITPSACFVISAVVVDGVGRGAISSYTFTNVSGPHTISVTFSALGPYAVTASAGTGGSISPSGAVSVTCGASRSFTISPDACHTIADVLVDGVSVGAVSSYTFTNVSGPHTISVTFSALGPYAVTASAGTGGSISPSGAVSVTCGASRSFTISPDACHTTGNVVIDGVAQGALSSFTFSNVTASHTIAASFTLKTNTIAASAATGGSISPTGGVSVNCGASQAFAISPAACHTIADVLVDGVSVGAVSSYTFTNVTAAHTIVASCSLRTHTISASAGAGGSISPSGSVSVTCGGDAAFVITPNACQTIADVRVDGVSQGARSSFTFTSVAATHTIAVDFASSALSTVAVTELMAAPVQLGNDGDGTTRITLTCAIPAGAATVEVWRRGFGSYPTYENGGGSVPTVPASYPPPGWTLTGVTASGQTDGPVTRDFWYYVAYGKDGCGNVAPVSNLTAGTLNYYLGDVSDAGTAGQGDNVVTVSDLSLLGAHYGLSGVALAPFDYLDVGPTTNNTLNGRPTADRALDLEDLILFAINYHLQAPLPQLASHPAATTSANDEIALEAPERVSAGEVFEVRVRLAGAGHLQAVSTALAWNDAVVAPLEARAGEMLAEQGGVMFSPRPAAVDAALLGANGRAMVGEFVLATVRFRAVADGSPGLAIARVIGRNAANRSVNVSVGATRALQSPATTALLPAAPNPSHGSSVLHYTLARGGPVDLSIFSVDGRRVRTLVHRVAEPGQYQLNWDGTDEHGSQVNSGVFYIRLEAGGTRLTRRFALVK